jgi:hypothetical protein
VAQPVFKDTSNSARLAVVYITLGALLVVWTGIWSFYLMSHGPVRDATWYWILGFLLSGLTLVGIGFGVGRIGRTARQADAGEHLVANPAAPMAVPVVPARAPEGAVPPNGGPPPQNSAPQVTA